MIAKLVDGKGRIARKLRISVTDTCNFACLFCMPHKNEVQWIPQQDILSFEEIIIALEGDKLLDVVIHPNQVKYPKQKMYVVELNNYAYLVPFVEDGDRIFLKTAFPSRQATKHYLKNRGDL